MTRALIEEHDVIVVMEHAHLLELRHAFPRAARRVVLLSLYDARPAGGYERYDIADPFGRPRPAFEPCYAQD